MRRLSAFVIVSGLIVTAAAGATVVKTRLVVSGAFHTTSVPSVTSQQEGCGFRTKARTLIYQSEAMRIGRGPAVASVEFLIPHFRGAGSYDARLPAPYSRTAVQVVTGRNAATGVASGFYIAKSGTVAVAQAKNVGRVGEAGSASGTVHVRLRLQRGTKRLRLDGSWHCRIDSGSNGG